MAGSDQWRDKRLDVLFEALKLQSQSIRLLNEKVRQQGKLIDKLVDFIAEVSGADACECEDCKSEEMGEAQGGIS